MNSKGFFIELMAFIIIGIIAVTFFAVFIYGFGLLNSNMASIDANISGANLSLISSNTLGKMNSGMGNLKVMAFVLLIGYAIASLIVAYFNAKHPLWIIVYIMISALLVIFSVYVSNAYETIKNDAVVGGMITGFTISDMIILNLPVLVAIIAFVGTFLSVVGAVIARRMTEGA